MNNPGSPCAGLGLAEIIDRESLQRLCQTLANLHRTGVSVVDCHAGMVVDGVPPGAPCTHLGPRKGARVSCIGYEDIPDTMDLFMNYQHNCAERRWIIDYPVSKPGDYIEFEAMMPLIVGLSNCPMDVLAPCNAYNCTQVKVEVRG